MKIFIALSLFIISNIAFANPDVPQKLQSDTSFNATMLFEYQPTTTPNVYKLSWKTVYIDYCKAEGDWSGDKPPSGSETVTITGASTFTLKCYGLDFALVYWVAPDKNVDGTPLTNLKDFIVYYSQDPSDLGTYTIETESTNEVILNLEPGTWYFGVVARNDLDVVSDLAGPVSLDTQYNEVFDTITLEPTLFTMSTDVVYTVVKKVNGFILLPVGTAPTTTECIPNQTVNGYFAIPREVVTWSGSVQPDVVVAQCSN